MREVDLPMAEDGLVTLRVYVDRSVVEAFANRNRACITGSGPIPSGLTACMSASSAQVAACAARGIDIWEMNSIYEPVGYAESRQERATADRYEFPNITDEEREILGWPKS